MNTHMIAPGALPGIAEVLPPAEAGLERKFASFEVVEAAEGGTKISGYASFFGQPDQSNDIVQPGAYAASLAALKVKDGRIRMLWQHDPAQPIGVWDEVKEDAKGLWVSGRILQDVAKGREAAALIDAGAIDGLSIGYRTVRASKSTNGARLLHELELWEVSLVTFPMLPTARVGSKSSVDPVLAELAQIFENARQQLAATEPQNP